MFTILGYFCWPILFIGAVIAVHGAMDSNGYYMATFEGCTGLVPANFVQEVEITNEDARQRLFNQVRKGGEGGHEEEPWLQASMLYRSPRCLVGYMSVC